MILLLSDIHCHFELINPQINAAEEKCGCSVDHVLVLGDMGFFPHVVEAFFQQHPEGFLRPLSCVEGNHEDFAALPDLVDRFSDKLAYLPRGTIHTINNINFLALGGAAYMDAASTPEGSEISEDDIATCLSHSPEAVDIIISHDCPKGIGVKNSKGMEFYGPPGFDRGIEIAVHLNPQYWFFGHYHRWLDLTFRETKFIGLAEVWKGYALLSSSGEVVIEKNELERSRTWWERLWFPSWK